MKAVALAMALLLQAAAGNEPPGARPDAMRYERAIVLRAGTGGSHESGSQESGGQVCAVLDAAIYVHAAPSLSDLRIFPAAGAGASAGGSSSAGSSAAVHEVPYAMTMSEAATEETEPARVLNPGNVGGEISFDLEMPERPYSDVTLELDPTMHDFLATATVTGRDALGAARTTALGTFTLFDLAGQGLARDTTLPLTESTFRYLHVELRVAATPGSARTKASGFAPVMVEGAEVPPSREAQIVYSTVAETSAVTTVGRESRAEFVVPARVPVERVEIVPAAEYAGNFSREVRVTATEEAASGQAGSGAAEASGVPGEEAAAELENDARAPLPEVVTGSILRVHATEAGREIRTEELGVPAVLGANLQRAAKVEVAIENGDDQPLPIAAVRLEMRQRRVCFDTSAADGASLALYYGEPRLAAPVYDYAQVFAAAAKPIVAELGPEQMNPAYRAPAVQERPFTERHPEALWIALIVAICALGTVALRSAKNVGR